MKSWSRRRKQRASRWQWAKGNPDKSIPVPGNKSGSNLPDLDGERLKRNHKTIRGRSGLPAEELAQAGILPGHLIQKEVNMKLKDAKILITGGSLGIGKATARQLVESGAEVAITGRDMGRLKKAAKETGAFPIVADVANPKDIEKTYDIFLKEFKRLDCLINNAGIGKSVELENATLKDFQTVYGVNVFGAALMAARATAIFKKQNYGHIVNIASSAGLRGYAGATVYAGTKFALRGMTECWRAELRKYNVRVILINPSEVATAFGSAQRVEREAASNKLSSDEIAYAIKAALEMDDRGFIPELSVWATNPW